MITQEETITPKETRLIMEILDIPVTRSAKAISCDKADLSACVNQRRRNRKVTERFAEYAARVLKEKLLTAGGVKPDEAEGAGPERGCRAPATVS